MRCFMLTILFVANSYQYKFDENRLGKYNNDKSMQFQRRNPIPANYPVAERRIKGGANATLKNYHYAAAILIYKRVWCSGAIIHQSYIITAAHCFNFIVTVAPPSFTFPQVRIRVGTTDAKAGGTMRKVTNIHRHPDFELEPVPHGDVALVRLDKDLEFSKTIFPVEIYPGSDEPFAQSFVHVTGYGGTTGNNTKEFSETMKVMRSARLKVTRMEYCNDAYDMINQLRITGDFFCAQLRNGTRDACLFDAGSPAVQNGILVGIMSFGPEGCGDDFEPAVFVRSYYFSHFARTMMQYRDLELQREKWNQFVSNSSETTDGPGGQTGGGGGGGGGGGETTASGGGATPAPDKLNENNG